MGDDHKPMV